ncbi:MAG: alpha-glucosidase [Halanaerobiales bacterium]|nr:alpha-glucosidase [Halanaerobiales bacterium]
MEKQWWKEGVVYQIYPRSFYDSNGDGIGDLQGIIQKLDYLKDLGVNIIWLSPVYKSPNDDNGYDISDYCEIMDEFGTMEDMEQLIAEMHKRDLKLIMDLVINHTSDEHLWFVESRSSIDNPYRDYYIWRKGKDGNPPNNWGSWFGGSAWEYDSMTCEYYLHLFSKKQPDLNWENQKVRENVYSITKWWLDKGIDGFRMDVINLISKVPGLPDGHQGEGDKYGNGDPFFINGPKVHDYLQEMNLKVLSKYDITTVGETPAITIENARKYVNTDRNELNMVFHFEHMGIDYGSSKWEQREWKLTDLKEIFTKWYEGLKEKGWNSLYLNNHDQPRMVSRFGDDDKYRVDSAKMLATLLHTLPGTPYIYQGEEIGMTNVNFSTIDDYRDIESLNWYHKQVEDGFSEEDTIKALQRTSRDNARTPVQWNDESNAGFTTGQPWIKVCSNYKEINVAKKLGDPESVLNYYKKLLRLRKDSKNQVMIYGDLQLVLEDHQQIYSYLRELDGDQMLVILNFSREQVSFVHDLSFEYEELLLSNYSVAEPEKLNHVELRPYEARVYRLKRKG